MSIRKNGYTYIYLGIFDFKCFKSHLRLQVQTLCYPNLVLSVNFGRNGFIKSAPVRHAPGHPLAHLRVPRNAHLLHHHPATVQVHKTMHQFLFIVKFIY
jgi:hypothetical protein